MEGDWMNLVWVGVGIKKARGVVGSGKCMFDTILAIQRGQGQGLRDLGEMPVKGVVRMSGKMHV